MIWKLLRSEDIRALLISTVRKVVGIMYVEFWSLFVLCLLCLALALIVSIDVLQATGVDDYNRRCGRRSFYNVD